MDANSLTNIISKVKPDEIYNFAAQSHVGVSFELPNYTSQVNSIGTLNLLQAIIDNDLADKTKFYQASTSNFTEKYKKKNNLKKLNFILKVLMQPQNYLHTG